MGRQGGIAGQTAYHVGHSLLFKCAEEPSLAGFLGTRFQAERLAHEKP